MFKSDEPIPMDREEIRMRCLLMAHERMPIGTTTVSWVLRYADEFYAFVTRTSEEEIQSPEPGPFHRDPPPPVVSVPEPSSSLLEEKIKAAPSGT